MKFIRWTSTYDLKSLYAFTDPKNERAHLVEESALREYGRGDRKTVTAVCGKTWSPDRFNTRDLRDLPSCQVCFPPQFRERSIVA